MLRRQLTIVITDGDSSQLWSLHTLDVDQPSNRPPPSLRSKSYFYPRLPSVNMTLVAQMSTDFLLSVILYTYKEYVRVSSYVITVRQLVQGVY